MEHLKSSFNQTIKRITQNEQPNILLNWYLTISSHLSKIWSNLNTPQKCYLISTILLAILPMTLWLLPSMLVSTALIMEFWPKFINTWHSLEGKAVILLFYAAIANFALATAASVVNEVVTVSASHFTYTHNIAILLYLPLWILGISFIALLLIQSFMPFYLFLLLCAKPFGIKVVKLVSKSSYPMMTGLVRFSLAAIVLSQIVIYLDEATPEKALEVERQESTPNPDSLPEAKRNLLTSNAEPFVLFNLYNQKAKELLAHFVFEIEADEYSRCQFDKKNKVVELNDYEVLEIAKDKSQKYGYTYTVKKCVSAAFPRS